MALVGTFIVLTGIDGCGKTTQINRLMDELKKMGLSSLSIKLSTVKLASYEELLEKYDHEFYKYSKNSHRLLFECLSMKEKINQYLVPQINTCSFLFADRYLESIFGISRQYEEGQKIIDYVFDGILKPDIAFLLDTDIQKAYNRMLLRNSISKEEITSKEVLKIMEHYYKNEFFFYPFTKIDGNGNVGDITEAILYTILNKGESKNGII